MNSDAELKQDVQTWLKAIFKNDTLSVNILGSSEKGDGYVGDIFFVEATNGLNQYNLVLKCGKKSEALRNTVPLRAAFINEMHIYNTIYPAFLEFQLEKGLEDIFDSLPKFYGEFLSENMEVIALQNLKVNGYVLWDKKKPLSRKLLLMVLKEYAKFHAISAAMKDQEPEKFEKITSGFCGMFRKFCDTTDVPKIYRCQIDETYPLIAPEVPESVAKKWRSLGDHASDVIQDRLNGEKPFTTIIHGDCWNNNFMFKFENGNLDSPTKLAMLDWQIAEVSTPVFDLSYFIYSCISKEDLQDFDAILKTYHDSFTKFLRKLGSDPEKIYPFKQLMADWQVYARMGILMAGLVIKIGVTKREEVVGMAESAERGQDLSETFRNPITNTEGLKKRTIYIAQHAADRNFI